MICLSCIVVISIGICSGAENINLTPIVPKASDRYFRQMDIKHCYNVLTVIMTQFFYATQWAMTLY